MNFADCLQIPQSTVRNYVRELYGHAVKLWKVKF